MAEPIPNRQLEQGYRVVPFAGQDAVGEDDLLGLWAREGALRPERARERLHDVLLIATHEADGLVGVSSAYLARNEQLAMTLWHFRAFVAESHRRSNVAVTLAVRGREMLERRFTSGEDSRAAGMVFEVQNEGLSRRMNLATWRQTDFTFIGLNSRGDQVRVRYFPGALAPDPPRG